MTCLRPGSPPLAGGHSCKFAEIRVEVAAVAVTDVFTDLFRIHFGVFRICCTLECEDQQATDIYFEDNHDKLYLLTFINEMNEEDETSEENTIILIYCYSYQSQSLSYGCSHPPVGCLQLNNNL